MTNYNHIINITKTILQFTAINNTNISNYNYTNQTINQVCFSLYTMFNNTKINPVYNLLINTIYISINSTLNCSFIHIPHLYNMAASIDSNIGHKLIKKYLHAKNSYYTFETVILLLLGIIISKIISMYILPNKNTKQKYI